MSPLYLALVILGIALTVLLAALLHAGLFYELRIRTIRPLHLPHRVAYKLHRGPYKQAGAAFKALSPEAPKQTLFGVFYDNPKTVPVSETRYIIGCCLPKEADGRLEKYLQSVGYNVWTFPECSNAVVTEFPCRSPLSMIVAPFRVYYALNKYITKRSLSNVGPFLEVCGQDCIHYIAPLENNDGFFVPEVAREEESKKVQ